MVLVGMYVVIVILMTRSVAGWVSPRLPNCSISARQRLQLPQRGFQWNRIPSWLELLHTLLES